MPLSYRKAAIAGALLVVFTVAPASAQTAAQEVYTPAAVFDAKVANPVNGPAVFDAPSSPAIRFTMIRRDKDGEPESHTAVDEHVYLLEGRLEYEIGGVLNGARTTAPNEFRGGEIVGARRYSLGPGDAMYIPAGVPHRIRLAPGVKSVRYLGVKNAATAK